MKQILLTNKNEPANNNNYCHLSIDEFKEAHLECDTDGLLFIAKKILSSQSKITPISKIDFYDDLPKYQRFKKNNEYILEYDHSISSIPELYIINLDCYKEKVELLTNTSKLTKKNIDILFKLEITNKKFKPIQKTITIPDLEPNQYPNISKRKDGFLWIGTFNNKAYLIGNSLGLSFLLKHIVYNCYIGRPGSGDHKHLQKELGDFDRNSLDLGIYNIDFMEEKYRKNYYKYR